MQSTTMKYLINNTMWLGLQNSETMQKLSGMMSNNAENGMTELEHNVEHTVKR